MPFLGDATSNMCKTSFPNDSFHRLIASDHISSAHKWPHVFWIEFPLRMDLFSVCIHVRRRIQLHLCYPCNENKFRAQCVTIKTISFLALVRLRLRASLDRFCLTERKK